MTLGLIPGMENREKERVRKGGRKRKRRGREGSGEEKGEGKIDKELRHKPRPLLPWATPTSLFCSLLGDTGKLGGIATRGHLWRLQV